MIVVRSRDPAWVWALAYFVDRHRSDVSDLREVDTINRHEPIARLSAMNAFFIGPPVGAPAGEGVVHLAPDDHVQLLQAFPVYEPELALVREILCGPASPRSSAPDLAD